MQATRGRIVYEYESQSPLRVTPTHLCPLPMGPEGCLLAGAFSIHRANLKLAEDGRPPLNIRLRSASHPTGITANTAYTAVTYPHSFQLAAVCPRHASNRRIRSLLANDGCYISYFSASRRFFAALSSSLALYSVATLAYSSLAFSRCPSVTYPSPILSVA